MTASTQPTPPPVVQSPAAQRAAREAAATVAATEAFGRAVERAKAEPVHSDHPLRHWDRTCPACLAEGEPECAECGGTAEIHDEDGRCKWAFEACNRRQGWWRLLVEINDVLNRNNYPAVTAQQVCEVGGLVARLLEEGR